MGVNKHSPQEGALLLVGACVQRWQDEALWGLQWIFEGIQRRNENRGPFSLGTTRAAVAMFGGQTWETRDGVEVGVMVAVPGKGAEWGQWRQHWKPVGEEKQERMSYTVLILHIFSLVYTWGEPPYKLRTLHIQYVAVMPSGWKESPVALKKTKKKYKLQICPNIAFTCVNMK